MNKPFGRAGSRGPGPSLDTKMTMQVKKECANAMVEVALNGKAVYSPALCKRLFENAGIATQIYDMISSILQCSASQRTKEDWESIEEARTMIRLGQ